MKSTDLNNIKQINKRLSFLLKYQNVTSNFQ